MNAIITAFIIVIAASIIDWQKTKTSFLEAWKKFWLKYILVFTGVILYYLLPNLLIAAAVGALVDMFSDVIWVFLTGLYNKVFKKK